MSKFRIYYIDDEPEQSRSFVRQIENTSALLDVIELNVNNASNLEEILSDLKTKNFDYLIVDYHLEEKGNCGFDGDKIVVEFAKKFPHFPVMLLTSHDNEAITRIEEFDLEKIHGKNEYSDQKLRVAFVNRIIRTMNDYRNSIVSAEKRLEHLIEKKNKDNNLDASEEEEAISLDTFLDEVLDGGSREISDQIKETNEEKISNLLNKTDSLIAKLEEYENISE